jgi:hypothetical protein
MTSHESEAVEGQFLLRAGASGSALEAWHGRDENLAVGQRAFYHRACLNGAASVGKYTDEMEAASPSGDDPPHRRDWRDD